MQFLIKWKDLPEEENSYISWKQANELEALDFYIQEHPELASLNTPVKRQPALGERAEEKEEVEKVVEDHQLEIRGHKQHYRCQSEITGFPTLFPY